MMLPKPIFCKDDRGATLVEFALVAPVFLMLLIGTIQLGVLGMISADFNNAVLEVSRRIRTGQLDGPKDAATFKSQICGEMVDGAASCGGRLRISVRALSDFSGAEKAMRKQDPDDLTKGEPFDAGTAGTIILVTATYKWPLMIPFAGGAFAQADGLDVLIVSRLTFKNEPYL
jgi:Flp pilus assembly protein TadG